MVKDIERCGLEGVTRMICCCIVIPARLGKKKSKVELNERGSSRPVLNSGKWLGASDAHLGQS